MAYAGGMSSMVVVIGSIVIVFTGWWAIDPLLSILVALVVGKWSWGLLRDSVEILLETQTRSYSFSSRLEI
jgi:cobalt-zinc-cadmium efflux system protein